MAIRNYIRLKLEVSRDHPQASRLFCLEMLQGAAAKGRAGGDLKALVDDKAAIIEQWIAEGRIAGAAAASVLSAVGDHAALR